MFSPYLGAFRARDKEKIMSALARASVLRLLPKERESKLVTSIEKGDALLALARTIRNPSHLLGVGTVMRGDRLAPSRRLGECRVPVKPRRGEAAKISRDIVGDLSCKSLAMGETARVGVALGGEKWDVGHGLFACRKSLMRTALPWERGISPGDLSTTSQVTPTIALTWWRTSAG